MHLRVEAAKSHLIFLEASPSLGRGFHGDELSEASAADSRSFQFHIAFAYYYAWTYYDSFVRSAWYLPEDSSNELLGGRSYPK